MNYESLRGRPPDFEVEYRFFNVAEGGRAIGLPYQHYRCDWSYEGDDLKRVGIFMIHPEFLTAEGEIVSEGERVPEKGRATMWILISEMRGTIHRHRLSVGTRGYFMEGSRKVAEAIVTQIIGLHTNPVG